MKAAYDQGYFTNWTWLFERKGNFDPNEIKFKVVICFKAEIKSWDLIIDSKFSEPILHSAETRGKIFEANEGKRMPAPVSRRIWQRSGSYFSSKLFAGSFHVFCVYLDDRWSQDSQPRSTSTSQKYHLCLLS